MYSNEFRRRYFARENLASLQSKSSYFENKIKEIKNGFAIDKNSQNAFLKNYAIAYNLLNWFKQVLLSANLIKSSIKTIRRIFINIPANIVKRGREKLTVNLPDNKKIEEVIGNINDCLYMFAFKKCYAEL
ncbi:transposase [Anoxybacter fermentans]|uniref:transposase n=1 Tax=Anoxybacter fermentans TaxID=1323375 RepID=UPI000F8D9ADF